LPEKYKQVYWYMVEENEKDKKLNGADDLEAAEENENAEEKAACKLSLFKKLLLFRWLKKFLIPAVSALGSFALAVVLFTFVFDGNKEIEPEIISAESAAIDSSATKSHKTPEVAKKPADKTIDEKTATPESAEPEKFTKEDVAKIEIDTSEIMKELDFLFVTPEDEAGGLGMTPEDSLDTLSWIEKEMANLIEEKNKIEVEKKELEALKYKIDQGLIKIEQAESSRIIKLARLYDGMKPNEVTKLFANLSDEVVISILPRMKSANASKILGLMPPKRAAKLSTKMITVLED